MNKWDAQQAYWSSFGLPAFNELTVRDDAQMPYITYQFVNGEIDGVVNASASLYYRGTSWGPICSKVMEMEPIVDRQVPIDGGVMKVRKPERNFAQPMNEPSDNKVRRMVLTVEIEFLMRS